VGTPLILGFSTIPSEPSMLIRFKETLLLRSAENRSSIGSIALQGLHQSAQNSTKTYLSGLLTAHKKSV
jgi:hypothetical protein